jgi:hypothetical protein
MGKFNQRRFNRLGAGALPQSHTQQRSVIPPGALSHMGVIGSHTRSHEFLYRHTVASNRKATKQMGRQKGQAETRDTTASESP